MDSEICIPSVVPLHLSHTVQMPEHTSDHSRHTCNTFEKDISHHVLSFCHCVFLGSLCGVFLCERNCIVMSIASNEIETPAKCTNSDESGAVGPVLDFAVGYFDVVQLLLGVA